jgi:hypothetical protein
VDAGEREDVTELAGAEPIDARLSGRSRFTFSVDYLTNESISVKLHLRFRTRYEDDWHRTLVRPL